MATSMRRAAQRDTTQCVGRPRPAPLFSRLSAPLQVFRYLNYYQHMTLLPMWVFVVFRCALYCHIPVRLLSLRMSTELHPGLPACQPLLRWAIPCVIPAAPCSPLAGSSCSFEGTPTAPHPPP